MCSILGILGMDIEFHKAPDAHALHEETLRKLASLHMYDCLRANKSMAARGVAARFADPSGRAVSSVHKQAKI